MKLFKISRLALLCLTLLFATTATMAQNVKKKSLTKREILSSLPEGIVNPLPQVLGWKDKENVKLLNRTKEGLALSLFNVKSGEVTPFEDKEEKKRLNTAPEIVEFRKLPNINEYKNYTLSPNREKIAFTNKVNNLCVYDVATKEITELTKDGTNLIMNGYASWVYYEEILGRSSNYRSFWWSPDSKQLAYYKFDDTKVPMFPIYDSRGQYGHITETHYPKAGDVNPEVKIAFVDVENGDTVWADFNHKDDQYFGIPFWNGEGNKFIIPWMPREQNHLILYAVDPTDGSKEFIYDEKQDSWIDWMSDMHFTSKGFYMIRDFDLWEQIYFQSFDGKELIKITTGNNWGTNILKVDEKEGAIYFTARREVSTRVDLYRVELKSKKITRLSKGDYSYSNISISPDNKHFVSCYSNSTTPTRLSVISIDKKAKEQVIADSKGDKFNDYQLALPEMLSLTLPSGYKVPAQVTWPNDLDSTKKYPVIISMYGGPNAGTVMDVWRGVGENTQWWANEGVIQISIDHRASGHCGKEGLNFLHRNLLTVELEDYIEWVKFLHSKPFVNREKIGINGFSYGGSMTAATVTRYPEYFQYGIAGGGVYDYALYDTHYTERYMDTPQTNGDGYKNTNAASNISKYKGDKTNYILITHGTSDDNVHMQNTMQLVNALQDAGKQFDLMLYPGEYHGYRGVKSLFSKLSDYNFWYRHLLEKETPKEVVEAKTRR